MTSEQHNDPAPLIVTDLHKSHGQGSTTVNALKGVSLQLEAGHADGDHGPIGLWQIDPACIAVLGVPSR